jgi:hypothetical protein
LRTPIGHCLILATPGRSCLLLLSPLESWIWEAQTAGWREQAIAEALTQRFGRPISETLADVRTTCRWVTTELQENIPAEVPVEGAPASGSATPQTLRADLCSCRTLQLSIADASIDLRIDHPAMAEAVGTLLEDSETCSPGPCTHTHTLRLAGSPDAWTLHADGVVRTEGTTVDEAIVQVVSALMDIGADIRSRLFVAHGAGLALPDGRGLLLIAAGGSGKTTLAAALNGEGWGLLCDDVVPVTPDGYLVALGTPICLKAGSWPLLAQWRPDLEETASVWRHGQEVRFLAPRGPQVYAPVPTGLLLFPRYRPGSKPVAEPLAPEVVLRRVVEADAVIRDLTQEKLEGIVRWVQSAPAYAITYPDLDSGLALIRALVAETSHCAH